jgi:hypothetical protein
MMLKVIGSLKRNIRGTTTKNAGKSASHRDILPESREEAYAAGQTVGRDIVRNLRFQLKY